MKFQNVSYSSHNTFNKSCHRYSVYFLHFNVNEEYFVPKSVVIVVAKYNGVKLITTPTSFNEERETNGTSYSVGFTHRRNIEGKKSVLFVVRRLGNTRESSCQIKFSVCKTIKF